MPIFPGVAVVPPLTLTDYGNACIEIGLAIDLSQTADKATTYTKTEVDGLLTGKATITCVDHAIANQSTLSINTLTTSSATLNIKSDLVSV